MKEQANISQMYIQVPENRITFLFTKKNVDEIITNSAHTDKQSIKYVDKFGHEDDPDTMVMSTRNQFSYDLFLWPWDKLYEWQHWPVDDIDDMAMRPRPDKSVTKVRVQTLLI